MTEHPSLPGSSESSNSMAAQVSVLTVSGLNRLARDVLERSFPLFWISGEISNLTRAASGHWYFSLKDATAQVRCVMFRGRNSYVDWRPQDGDNVEARVLVGLYEARGEFQLTIEFLRRAGLGALFEAYERLRQKLSAEGLFDASRKRTIPQYPRQIGIVTSADGAALHDVLTTLKRRMPSISVIVYPTPVQGKGAASHIAAAIDKADRRTECDVLIICRGGGSIEDLWSFNEEAVARAIASCSIPIINGVGHETDFTIADFAADQRAATPTAAAELASPNRAALMTRLWQHQQQLIRLISYRLQTRNQQLDFLARRLLSPGQQLAHKQQQLAQLQSRLQRHMHQSLQGRQQQLSRLAKNLHHLNPHAVLARGYALALTTDGHIIQNSAALTPWQTIHLTFSQGHAAAQVTVIDPA